MAFHSSSLRRTLSARMCDSKVSRAIKRDTYLGQQRIINGTKKLERLSAGNFLVRMLYQ